MRRTEPKTLRDAHEVVMDRRPPKDANPSVWLAFRLGNARLYKTVVDIDRGHHHEALYWAGYARSRSVLASVCGRVRFWASRRTTSTGRQ